VFIWQRTKHIDNRYHPPYGWIGYLSFTDFLLTDVRC